MSLRVRDLLDNPALGTRLLAGKTGLDRTVAWAHSCEVAKPWEWMGSDELLMSIPGAEPPSLRKSRREADAVSRERCHADSRSDRLECLEKDST